MCPPKPKTPPPPAPPPAAPPPPSETAMGYAAAGDALKVAPHKRKRGIDALRVDLNVPRPNGSGVNIP